jgi:hypothetical protein
MDEPEWEINPRFCHAVSALLVDRYNRAKTRFKKIPSGKKWILAIFIADQYQ